MEFKKIEKGRQTMLELKQKKIEYEERKIQLELEKLRFKSDKNFSGKEGKQIG